MSANCCMKNRTALIRRPSARRSVRTMRLMRDNYERGLYEGEEYQYWQKVNALKEKLELLNRIPEAAIDRAASTLLNLHEAGSGPPKKSAGSGAHHGPGSRRDVGTKRIMWVKVKPDYEILFRLMDGLRSR